MVMSESLVATTATNKRNYLRKASAVWKPIDAPPIAEWIETKLRFGKGSGVQLESKVGPMSFSDRPWFRFPIQCFASRYCNSLAFPAATQIGKTATLIISTMLYAAEWRPAPGMIILPNEPEAKKFRDRVYAIVQESAKFTTFERIKLKPEHKWNMQEIHLGSMVVHLAWAGSRQATRGKPCHYVWMTEIDVYRDADPKAGDPIEAGKQRTKDVFRYTHVMESSPRESPSAICDEEAGADGRWRWHVACPHCGHKQEVRFFQHKQGKLAGRGGIELTIKGMGKDGAELMTSREARDHAYYVCEHGCTIFSDRKNAMMESGDWYPLGWDHSNGTEPDRKPPRTAGFHLWAAHSPNETWGTIAADYLEHMRKGKKIDFFSNRIAIAYEAESKVPNWMELGRRLAWPNVRRTVPSQCWFLTAGIDKQGENNGTRYVIRGWAPGRTSWLIDWGWVERSSGDENDLILSDLVDTKQRVLDSDFLVVDRDNRPSKNPLGKDRMRVRLANVDTRHLPRQIHRWLRSLPDNWVDRYDGDVLKPGRIRSIIGDVNVKADVRYRHNLVETNSRTGEKYEGGLHLWGIAVYPFYSDLTELLSGQPGNIGSWYVTADALAMGREYLEQVTNFCYEVKWDPKKGKKGKWGPRSTKVPVDFWDCEIYAMAAAEMVVGDMGWDVNEWEKWRQLSARNEKARADSGQASRRTRQVAGIGDR